MPRTSKPGEKETWVTAFKAGRCSLIEAWAQLNIDHTLLRKPLNDEKIFSKNPPPGRGAGLGSGSGSGSGSVGSEVGAGMGSETGTTGGAGVGVGVGVGVTVGATVGACPFQITSVCLIGLWLTTRRSAEPLPVVSTDNVKRPVFGSWPSTASPALPLNRSEKFNDLSPAS